MNKTTKLAWIAVPAALGMGAALLALTVYLWPPGLVAGLLLAALYLLPAVCVLVLLIGQRERQVSLRLPADVLAKLSEPELTHYRLQQLADAERRLELRELRLARQLRTSELARTGTIDLLQANPSDEELDALVGSDRKLIALIEEESQIAFDRILKNRYADGDGVNSALILADVRAFVEKVARLYRPEAENALMETEIELIAKSLSSASLHLLLVVDDLPLNLKSYNTAKVYRLIRRGVSYYGTYKAFRPYLEHSLNALQLARLALGFNPITVGAAWLAGKLTTHGAKTVGEQVLQKKALQLVTDFIRVIGYESAMMYGGGFGHRDANWVFGAMLVNLEISRGADFSGRDAALARLCSLVLRSEYDRIQLLTHLARHKIIDVERMKPSVTMTNDERHSVASELAKHGEETQVDLDQADVTEWQSSVEAILQVNITFQSDESPLARGIAKRSYAGWLKKRLRAIRRQSTPRPDREPGNDGR